MISGLRNIKVTTRIMSLACFLVAVMAFSLVFLLIELELIDRGSTLQQAKVAEQNQWIQQEAESIDAQAHTQALLHQVQKIQQSYSDMLFWYFDGSVTQYYGSLNNATAAAEQLEQQLTKLSMDSEASQKVPAMLKNLADYRSLMDGAIQYYMQGRDNLAGSEISDAHLVVQDMNDQLLQLTALFQKRLKEANLNVENALDHTLEASVSVADYSQKASERIKDIEQRTLIILLFSIPLAILVAVSIILSITRPLKRLEEQLISIESHSDLTQHLSIEGKDEISAMSLAIRNLLAKFCSTLSDMDDMAAQLKSTANNGLVASEKTHQQSSEQQTKSAGIASTATELGASAEDILRTTGQGLNLVEAVASAAKNGQQDVRDTAHTIGQLAEQFDQVENSVKDLVSHSSSIGSVLAVIRDIAEQTNLLALNAAIEAARAGDQGRGFAVVADEVRTLAQRTGQSTNEIQDMVEKLQGQSRLAIRSLENNRHQVDAGVQLSKQAETSLNAIIQEMQALSEINQSIAAISGEQQQAVLTVDKGVQDIRQLAEQVESHASDSCGVNQSLDQMAEQLQCQIQVFKH